MNHKIFNNVKCKCAFTMVELVLGLVIITVILISASTLVENMTAASRFRKTVDEIRKLSTALTGDSDVMQTGHQAEFGYFELHNVFPSGANELGLSKLYEVMLEPTSVSFGGVFDLHDLIVDEWGEFYEYVRCHINQPGKISSLGRDRVIGGSGIFNSDIDFTIGDKFYFNNRVRIYVKDANGAILRGMHGHGSDNVGFHMIIRAELKGFGGGAIDRAYSSTGVVSLPTRTLVNDDGSIIIDPSDSVLLTPGFYMVSVSLAKGDPFGGAGTAGEFFLNYLTGLYDPTPDDNPQGVPNPDDFNDNDEYAIRKMIVVYPRGPGVEQVFEIRLPGVLDQRKVGDCSISAGA